MTRGRITVSDHAVLRYLERVGGFDIDGLRRNIAERVGPAVRAGATGVNIDGFAFRVTLAPSGPVITTVLDASGGGSRGGPGEDVT